MVNRGKANFSHPARQSMSSRIHHPRFLRVQCQSRLLHPLFHLDQRREGFGFGVQMPPLGLPTARRIA